MKHAELLEQIRKDYSYALSYWRPMREERAINVRYVSGDPWKPEERAQREKEGQQRPCLVFDELNQYVNQLVNSVRLEKRAIELLPRGSGANDKEAEHRANIVRGIEYESNAQAAYIRAFEDAVIGGYGFARVHKEYVNDNSFEMELRIEPVVNPDSILMDPDAKKADMSDARFFFEEMPMRMEVYKQEFPNSKFEPSMMQDGSTVNSFNGDTSSCNILSYWYVSKTPDQLLYLRFADGTEGKANLSDLRKEGYSLSESALVLKQEDGSEVVIAEVLKSRKNYRVAIKNCITNLQEILEESEWEGQYLPIAVCLAKEIYIPNGTATQRRFMPLVSLARDPYMLYCYYRSTEAEIVGQTPKTPYVGYAGQFAGFEQEWEMVNRAPLPYLQANATTEEIPGQVLPLPQKANYEPPIQALEIGAESARRAIQAAMGISALPTAAQRQNEKSGVALERIATQQAQGSFHFVDNYQMNFLKRLGIIINDMLPKVYDTSRDVASYDKLGKFKMLRINEAPEAQEGEAEAIQLTDSDYTVTIGSGPSFDSQREEADQFLNGLAGTPMGERVMDLIVKMKQLGPIGDEIAERLTPPDIKAQQEMGDIPPQIASQLQQMQQAIEALNEYAKELEKENATLKANVLQEAIKIKGEIQKELVKGKIQLVQQAVKEDSETRRVVRKSVLDAKLREIDAEIAAQQAQQQEMIEEATEEATEESEGSENDEQPETQEQERIE